VAGQTVTVQIIETAPAAAAAPAAPATTQAG